MQSPAHLWARWGLLVTTGVTAAVLVGTASVSYLGAHEAAAAIVRARALDLSIAVRHTLRLGGPPNAASLTELLDDMQEQGLRSVAIAIPGEPPLVAGDIAPRAFEALVEDCSPAAAVRALDWRGEEVLFAQPLFAGRGPGMRKRWLPRWRELEAPRNACLVLSFSAQTAHAALHRALGTLSISIAAAALLLGVALGFWRLSRRAEQARAELLVDRHLRSLGEVSAVLGHELRNPLASLKGHAQLLVEKLEETHPGRRGAETVVREALRLEELTAQVLEFARTAAVTRAPADAIEVARAAVATIDDGRVQLIEPATMPRWSLDTARLEQALVNLLRNALQSSEAPEPVELEVTWEERRLAFEVRDRGPGIDPRDLERIFEPFHTRRVRGTGLGLAVARRIAEGHGGSLRALNRPDGGAVFRLEVGP